jgi:hypothetical protein
MTAASGAGLPNYGAGPVTFGSTTRADGVSGARPIGSVSAAVKLKPQGFRQPGFKPPRGAGGGFAGQVAVTAGPGAGPRLFTGRPKPPAPVFGGGSLHAAEFGDGDE